MNSLKGKQSPSPIILLKIKIYHMKKSFILKIINLSHLLSLIILLLSKMMFLLNIKLRNFILRLSPKELLFQSKKFLLSKIIPMVFLKLIILPQYPPQAVVAVPDQAVQPVYNAEYQNYSNVRQINHKGVFQPAPNTFYISTGCCTKSVPFIIIMIGIFIIIISILIFKLLLSIIELIFFICGLYFCCKLYNNINFVMGKNNLIVIKKAYCPKQTNIYNPGELLRLEFKYSSSYSSNGKL